MDFQSTYISNKEKPNQRIHRSIFSNDRIINKIEYSEQKKCPPTLLKFYSVNENNINALVNSYLYAASPISFNDPFDCPIQLWDEKIFSQLFMLNTINPLFSSIWKDDNNENKEHFFNFFFGFIGIICLNNPNIENQDLMWGYYTNQQGFAVSFNSDELFSSWGMPFPIEYLGKTKLDRFNIDSLERNDMIELLPRILRWSTQKDITWASENEWRFLFLDCLIDTITFKSKTEDRKKKYNSNAINEIFLGNSFFESQYSVYKDPSQFIYLTDKKKVLQNKLLTFLSIPQKIKIRHMSMKKDELQLYPRECRIWKQDENRFRIEYLEQ